MKRLTLVCSLTIFPLLSCCHDSTGPDAHDSGSSGSQQIGSAPAVAAQTPSELDGWQDLHWGDSSRAVGSKHDFQPASGDEATRNCSPGLTSPLTFKVVSETIPFHGNLCFDNDDKFAEVTLSAGKDYADTKFISSEDFDVASKTLTQKYGNPVEDHSGGVIGKSQIWEKGNTTIELQYIGDFNGGSGSLWVNYWQNAVYNFYKNKQKMEQDARKAADDKKIIYNGI